MQRRLLHSSDFEFVYGHASVLAALHSQKRQRLKTLYLQSTSRSSPATTKKKDSTLIESIVEQCRQRNIPVITTNKGELNNLTQDKPHQGVVLEASPRATIELTDPGNIRPGFWIALDQVQDPQNLGSILRTAHFFGVDGVLLCSKNSAPLTPSVSKVSSGAMEVMDIYSTRSLVNFLKACTTDYGWHTMAASAPEPSAVDIANIQQSISKDIPRMLVLGSEGLGLRTNVKLACKQRVTIPNPSSTSSPQFKGHVDSLNVGVAAGILISHLARI
ncbi:rrna methylase family protein [Lichtheimia corymbifera JMRC:FSU:9682]|uniref:rRNA methyltransferase 1, mitochondrial n=1 Tax=Lichtheimia corymbifera JMRC:FSU:9682 TaxID=1263082 RepID=A0A068S6X7_9FUNG|nr:rrna methylase family protein [Lichtheimia corymbifera JMRC:FSU:9682]